METQTDFRRPDGFSELVQKSGREHKLLLIAICSDNHLPSQHLLIETLEDPQLAHFLDRGFLYYQARTGEYYSHDHYLARRYGVEEYPSLLLLNAAEEVIWQYQGFLSPQELMYHLSRFLPGSPALSPAFLSHVPVSQVADRTPYTSQAENRVATAQTDEDFIIMDNIDNEDPAEIRPLVQEEVPAQVLPPNPPVRFPAIAASGYGLIIQTHKNLEAIRQSARRWQLAWDGDIWIQEGENGNHQLILGSLTTERAARNKRLELRKKNGIRAKLLSLSPQNTSLALQHN